MQSVCVLRVMSVRACEGRGRVTTVNVVGCWRFTPPPQLAVHSLNKVSIVQLSLYLHTNAKD